MPPAEGGEHCFKRMHKIIKYGVSKTRQAQRLMDDMIDLEIDQIDKILSKIDSDPENETVKY